MADLQLTRPVAMWSRQTIKVLLNCGAAEAAALTTSGPVQWCEDVDQDAAVGAGGVRARQELLCKLVASKEHTKIYTVSTMDRIVLRIVWLPCSFPPMQISQLGVLVGDGPPVRNTLSQHGTAYLLVHEM